MNKLDMQSKDIVRDNLEYIKERFPEAVTEENGKLKLDIESLRESLSTEIYEDKKEKYELAWPGKRQAKIDGNTRITKTLRPLKDKSVNFNKTENIYIEGDNLEALKILQESYLNKIKCIYIDPPYNTGNDFIYNDNFNKSTQDELYDSGQVDSVGNRLVANNSSNGRFHSDWLSMMYSRLKLARNFLKDDGIIFISIDDNEYHNLKYICDEIFGENSFICNFIRTTRKGGGSMSKYVSTDNDYCLMYAKNISAVERFYVPYDEKYLKRYSEEDEIGRYFWDTFARNRQGSSNNYAITAPDGTTINGAWIYQESKFKELYEKGDVRIKKVGDNWSVQCKQRLNEAGQIMRSQLNDFTNEQGTKEVVELLGRDIFSYAKPVGLIKYLINSVTKNGDIVLDFFSGSATTAQSVLELNSEDNGNRKYIMIQLDEPCQDNSVAKKNGYNTICDIGEERIRRSAKKVKEETKADIDYGFRVYKVNDSNMKDEFYMTPDKISQEQIRLFEDNIKEDRTPDDLITQVILNLGLKLDLPIEEKDMCGNKVFDVDDGELLACFDNNVNIDIIEEIAKINPRQVVFRDSSFATDQDKVNFEERLKRLSAGTKFNVL